MAITKTQGKFSKGIDDGADANAITINSSEQVGIGTANPSDKLHVYGGASGASAHSYTQLHVEHSSHAAIQLSSPNTTESAIFFSDPQSNSAGGVGYYHAEDFMYLRANGSTRLRVDSDGIKFAADTAAANALDDYEEGTWTPAYGATTGSFSSVSYQNQIGTYAKVGNIVTAHGRIDTTGSSIGTASGYLLITGFPYASVSAYQSGPCAYSWGFSSVHPTAVSFQGSSSSAYLFAVDRATTTGSIVPSNVASGSSTSYLYFGITYRST